MDNPYKVPLGELKKAAFPAPQVQTKPAYIVALDNAYAEFRKNHPDFVATPENCAELVKGLDHTIDPTPDQFRMAHAIAVYENRYVVPTGPPLETDPNKMSLNELSRLVGGLPQRPEVSELDTMPMDHLRCLMEGSPIPSKEQNEWTMPKDELRKQMVSTPIEHPVDQTTPIATVGAEFNLRRED